MHAVLKVRSKAGTGQLAEQGLFSSAHDRTKATSSVGGRGVRSSPHLQMRHRRLTTDCQLKLLFRLLLLV